MSALKSTIIRGGLETLYFSGANLLMRPFVHGVGAILTLHHVRPARPDNFQPNRLLEVTPHFLETVVRYLRRRRLDLVSLDEMHRRLVEGNSERRFVCITIDDGYLDTMEWAYPILKRYEVPFALYIPTSFPDRLGELWWLALEAVVARNGRITLLVDGRKQGFDCSTVSEKRDLYDQLYRYVRSLARQASRSPVVSGRRFDLSRAARIPYRPGTRIQDGGHHAGGRIVSGALPASHRAAAHFAQRRVSATALCACAAIGLGDRDVARLQTRRRCLDSGQKDGRGRSARQSLSVCCRRSSDIQRISGIATSTQPSPATT
jgi:peptidoglycan/xylan/chitin deacetylase (PgdA/CDA1 family)